MIAFSGLPQCHQEQSFAHEDLCGLLRIDLVTSIGRYTFDGCSSSSVAFLVQQFELCMSTHGLLVPPRTANKLKLHAYFALTSDLEGHSMHNCQRMCTVVSSWVINCLLFFWLVVYPVDLRL